MATDGQAVQDMLNRIGRLEQWADIPNAEPYTNAQVITAIERRIVHIESVADQIVNGALVPELRALSDRVNAIGTGIDQNLRPELDNTTTKSNTTETALQDLTAKLNEFPTLIRQEIANSLTGLNDKVAAIEQAMNAGTPLTSSGDRGKKIITEYKIIGAQKQLSNDKKEYRQWQEKMKNAMEQVSPDVREVMERIETTVCGKAEEREWLEKLRQR